MFDRPYSRLAHGWDHMLTCYLRIAQGSPTEHDLDSSKKPRRSSRLSQRGDADEPHKTPISNKNQLPSPVTHISVDESSNLFKEGTATPPEGRPSQFLPRGIEEPSQVQGFSSPPQDTQAFPSQFVDPNEPYSKEVKDEAKEGVWGYLFPLNTNYGGKCKVLRKRGACPKPATVGEAVDPAHKKGKRSLRTEEAEFDHKKVTDVPAGGYLIGRHPECGKSCTLRACVKEPPSTDTMQTLLWMIPVCRTDTACSSQRTRQVTQ